MNIEKGLQILDSYGFHKKLDNCGEFNRGRHLYCLKIRNNQYIVFSLHELKKGIITGFDSWICTYQNIIDIGKVFSTSKEILKFSFDFEDDMELLKKHLPKRKSKQMRTISGLSYNSIISKYK